MEKTVVREIKKYFSHDSTSDEGMNIEISYLVERSHIAKLKEKKKIHKQQQQQQQQR